MNLPKYCRLHQEVIRRTHDEFYDVKWNYIRMFNNIDVLQFIFILLFDTFDGNWLSVRFRLISFAGFIHQCPSVSCQSIALQLPFNRPKKCLIGVKWMYLRIYILLSTKLTRGTSTNFRGVKTTYPVGWIHFDLF